MLVLLMYNVKFRSRTDANEASALYNAMVHPFLQMPIYGAIWYQGKLCRLLLNACTCSVFIYGSAMTLMRYRVHVDSHGCFMSMECTYSCDYFIIYCPIFKRRIKHLQLRVVRMRRSADGWGLESVVVRQHTHHGRAVPVRTSPGTIQYMFICTPLQHWVLVLICWWFTFPNCLFRVQKYPAFILV